MLKRYIFDRSVWAERFVASLLALTSLGSYNTGYTARFTRPNSAKDGTSYSPNGSANLTKWSHDRRE